MPEGSPKRQRVTIPFKGFNASTTLSLIESAAKNEESVLFLGETGTGKSALAHWLFELASERNAAKYAGKMWVETNLVAAGDLAGSELFGHVKGAFTSASESRNGKIVEADGTMLFVDELSHVDYSIQAQLLRTMENSSVTPLGAPVAKKKNVKVWYVAAASGKRPYQVLEDLAFRFDNVFELRTLNEAAWLNDPPDLFKKLVQSLLEELRAEKPDIRLPSGFSEEAIDHLKITPWPGNVRQLRKVVRQIAVSAIDKTKLVVIEDVKRSLRVDWYEALKPENQIKPNKNPSSPQLNGPGRSMDLMNRLRALLHEGNTDITPFSYETIVGMYYEEFMPVPWDKEKASHRLGIKRKETITIAIQRGQASLKQHLESFGPPS